MTIQSKAVILRKKGYSYNEIQKLLGVPKSTLSNWLSCVSISEKAKLRLQKRVAMGTLHGLVARNKRQTTLARERANKTKEISEKEIPALSKKDLFLIGIALYWAEGYKRIRKVKQKEVTSHAISFTNSDGVMVKTFVDFLMRIMKIDRQRIKLEVRIFSHMERDSTIKYWSKMTTLPVKNMSLSVVGSPSILSKRPFDRLPFGTVSVRVCDTQQFYRLIGWINGMQKSIENFL